MVLVVEVVVVVVVVGVIVVVVVVVLVVLVGFCDNNAHPSSLTFFCLRLSNRPNL